MIDELMKAAKAIEIMGTVISEKSEKITHLETENAKLRKALNWYGNFKNWTREGRDDIGADVWGAAYLDQGNIARTTLEECK